MTDAVARYREIVERVENPNRWPYNVQDADRQFLARAVREVLEDVDEVLAWDGTSMFMGKKLVDRHAIIAYRHGCIGQAQRVVAALERALNTDPAPPQEEA